MTPLVVGTREDVAGFALAGVGGVVCATKEEAEQAIARAGADTLVLLSAEFGREPSGDTPIFVLPSRS